jgi:hypothetical protein
MAEAAAQEYRAVIAAAAAGATGTPAERRRTLARLRRELRRIGSRDHFPPPERADARHAVEALARSAEAAA